MYKLQKSDLPLQHQWHWQQRWIAGGTRSAAAPGCGRHAANQSVAWISQHHHLLTEPSNHQNLLLCLNLTQRGVLVCSSHLHRIHISSVSHRLSTFRYTKKQMSCRYIIWRSGTEQIEMSIEIVTSFWHKARQQEQEEKMTLKRSSFCHWVWEWRESNIWMVREREKGDGCYGGDRSGTAVIGAHGVARMKNPPWLALHVLPLLSLSLPLSPTLKKDSFL